jgi:hypothetical protein
MIPAAPYTHVRFPSTEMSKINNLVGFRPGLLTTGSVAGLDTGPPQGFE